jgi:hypothetical protein
VSDKGSGNNNTLDPRERFKDWDEATRRDAESHQSKMFTAVPAIVKKHDVDKNTVHAQPTIKMLHAKADGSHEWLQMPKLEDVPIHYPRGGGAVVTMPVGDGDEGLLVFSMRSIDKWWQQGGVQEQTDARMHDISDAFFIPGFNSQPRKIKNVSTSKWQLRTDEETPTHYVEFDPANKKYKIKSPNPVEIDADLHVTGAVIAGYGGADQVALQTHTHAQDPDSHGDTEQETKKPTAGT